MLIAARAFDTVIKNAFFTVSNCVGTVHARVAKTLVRQFFYDLCMDQHALGLGVAAILKQANV